jgi:N-acetyl sugar amidotransferase
MDTTASEIVFDNNGYCNFCTDALIKLNKYYEIDSVEKRNTLQGIINRIKAEGKGKKYDSIIGLSGGIDSSYLAYVLVKAGLHPIAVHLDNGWNTEFAVQNIHNLVTKLDLDLYTHVVDWNEFKELQRAFIKASVIDLELLSDHAINSLFYKVARKYRIKYLLGGSNLATESILPTSWIHPKYDGLNIMSIYKMHGRGLKIKTYPYIDLVEYLKIIIKVNNFQTFPILDLIDYRKEQAIETLENEIGYKTYPYKHYESRITHFYQAYILPKKFGVDKRRAHLSSLICSNQLNRDQALTNLEEPLYDLKLLMEDIEYFKKKLELTEQEFEDFISAPQRSHYEYRTYASLFKRLRFWK